jgi:hypothetical protein
VGVFLNFSVHEVVGTCMNIRNFQMAIFKNPFGLHFRRRFDGRRSDPNFRLAPLQFYRNSMVGAGGCFACFCFCKTLLFPLFGEFSYFARVPSIAKKGEPQRLAVGGCWWSVGCALGWAAGGGAWEEVESKGGVDWQTNSLP